MNQYRDQSLWTAQQTLARINSLMSLQEQIEQEAQSFEFALALAYEFLTQKRITWSVNCQKITYEFLQLAFITKKQSNIKQVLKSYRNLTQGQYWQSLKDVLQYYRDNKLQVILSQQILDDDLELIRNMPSIQIDEASSQLILASFNPIKKKKTDEIKEKLKIVWQGYKSIVQTVRVNQKLEQVYMKTLNKIFDFVDQYNRKHEFKAFCKNLRSGLQNAFNKRDKNQQQKAIYIDIEKPEVNNRNIDIRLTQFKITIKLGLWQQAFQVLEDINNLMKIRRGIVRNSYRCQYYENLAFLFKKSNYWHYHAYAFYNYYICNLTNPKITLNEKQEQSDKLLLSVLCIPPITIQSNQNKQSQQKICSMMISSTKIPDKKQLFSIMISKGIVQNSSKQIQQLWNFMFLEFNLYSLIQGLKLLEKIQQKHLEFKNLLENILIYRQLILISQIYRKIKMSSLLKLIPLSKEKIQKILLQSHQQKAIEFQLDQSQGIIIFQDKINQTNPYQEFIDIFIEVAVLKEKYNVNDQSNIKGKAIQFLSEGNFYYEDVRADKIQKFYKKMKQPKKQLIEKQRKLEQQKQEQNKRLSQQKVQRQMQRLRVIQQKQKLLATKKILVDDIIKIKQYQIIRINGKKIQELNDEEISQQSQQNLRKTFDNVKILISNLRTAKHKKIFSKIDYFQRQRRQILDQKIRKINPNNEKQEQLNEMKNEISILFYQQMKKKQQNFFLIMPIVKKKIDYYLQKMEEQYQLNLEIYQKRLTENYKQKIINRAKTLLQADKDKAEEDKRKQEQMKKLEAQSGFIDPDAQWTFRGNKTADGTESNEIVIGKALKNQLDENKEKKSYENTSTWTFKARQTQTETQKKNNDQAKDIKLAPKQKIYVNVNQDNQDKVKQSKQIKIGKNKQ